MRYRHLPTEVEAIQWDGTPEGAGLIRKFVGTHGTPRGGPQQDSYWDGFLLEVVVAKVGRWVEIKPGMWVIRERDGEGVYPCTDVQFVESYEAVLD
jgi:hypothetical protein